MLNSPIRKKYFNLVSIVFLLLSSVSAEAYLYYSNDPKGNMFVQKPYGDMVNCGPLSALMLTKFADKKTEYKNISGAIDSARMNVQKQEKGDISYRWWSLRDIKKFLSLREVKYKEVDTRNYKGLKNHTKTIVDSIVDGNVVVVNIDMNDLKKNAEIGKFYGTTGLFGRWGHFLVIVGYRTVNSQLAYEIHDSYSEKGKNRLFYAKDINHAISRYNKKILLVRRGQDIKQDVFN